ncbi:MAG TPA: hypothetical protein DEE98_06515 [Elusimicrobia bacterium]|nr:MAG: hypothetical protein A2278_06625 [Elusimicrobia bacterium RIFOXYA12_FULL_49_49]OGS10104.1 MAG: hypothetical protein A2204_06990 [Elusimicrobia bacterium RIFOXYA1_FULL_47_7]OGS16278.1 MAG: hypothetical protein A2251_01560 [Elusimicrobia bacterium RIFOXYA2_FULL_47_53]OGS26180.1 MAG: hypothetical protein A2339_02535 [Elusimicrobia bacterium RIFOXYB12_FULL_50_12]OGS31433.1 MAG: hypothetical protein A2323_09850 [Elusimicrobia bacterium RIFOXYB2_FULL_46_23]HBU70024.1 hypothetical protein [El
MFFNRKFVALAALLAVFSASVFAKVVDKTIAVVNGEAIMSSEFDKAVMPVLEQYKTSVPESELSDEKIKEFKTKLLDQMVDDRILKQQAKKDKIRVSKRDVEQGVKEVRSRFPSETEFQGELKKEGLTSLQFEKRIEDQLMVMKLIEQEIKSKLSQPAEGDVKKLYDQIQGKIEGKKLGLDKKEEDELETLAKLFNRVSSEQVRAKHILVTIDKNATMAEKSAALAKIKKVQKELKGGADFSELAKKYSDDPGSKNRGGDLGYFAKGDMVPEFEKAAFSLQVGQVSEPVLTDFGYHIIKVDEKKASKRLSFEDAQNDLKQYLYQKSAQVKYEEYLKGLRAKSSIKINSQD